jgi:hypothetical protein
MDTRDFALAIAKQKRAWRCEEKQARKKQKRLARKKKSAKSNRAFSSLCPRELETGSRAQIHWAEGKAKVLGKKCVNS